MHITKLVIFEVLLLIIGISLAIIWSQNPSDNYEPYIVALGFGLTFIEFLRRKNTTRTNRTENKLQEVIKTTPLVSSERLSNLTVREILDQINLLPLFQKENASHEYSGIKVKWDGYLKEVMTDPRNEENVRINLNIHKDDIIGDNFWFSIKVEDFPEIKVLKNNSAIRVTGEIIDVTPAGLCVSLKPIEVTVIEAKNT